MAPKGLTSEASEEQIQGAFRQEGKLVKGLLPADNSDLDRLLLSLPPPNLGKKIARLENTLCAGDEKEWLCSPPSVRAHPLHYLVHCRVFQACELSPSAFK